MTKKKGASEERLGDLHDKYTGILEFLLENAAYKESVDEMGDSYIIVNSKVLDLVAKHLKDNNITAIPTMENATGRLAQAMEKRQGLKRFGPKVVDMPGLTKEAVNE